MNAAAQAAPVTVSITPVADTYICDFPGFDPNGTGSKQFFQVIKAGTSNCHAFLRFDLVGAGLFAGSSLLSANLSLYQAAFVYFGPTDRINVSAVGTAAGFSEPGLVWEVWSRNPSDHPVTAAVEEASNATTGTRVEWNVTPLVDSWVQLILPNHGFRLFRSSGDGTVNFASREALNTTWRARLDVRYLPVAPADPADHPLADEIATLGVPVALFLGILGMAVLVLVYFGIYAAHNPEIVGQRKRKPPRLRFRRRRRR